MSIDIRYHSFDEARADAQWELLWNLDLEKLAEGEGRREKLTERLYVLNAQRREKASVDEYFRQQEDREPTEIERFNYESMIESGEIEWTPDVEKIDREIEEINQKTNQPDLLPMNLEYSEFVSLLGTGQAVTNQDNLKCAIRDLDFRFGAITASLQDPRFEGRILYVLLSVLSPDSEALIKDPLVGECDPEKLSVDDWKACVFGFDPDKVRVWFSKQSEMMLSQLDVHVDDVEILVSVIDRYLGDIKEVVEDLVQPGREFIYEVNGECGSTELDERVLFHLEKLLDANPNL